MLREQRTLFAIFAFDKALHFTPVAMRYWLNVYRADFVYTVFTFLHSLDPKQPLGYIESPGLGTLTERHDLYERSQVCCQAQPRSR
jgi:hypothetical protein